MLVLVLEFSKISANDALPIEQSPLNQEHRGMRGLKRHHSRNDVSLLQNGRRESSCAAVT